MLSSSLYQQQMDEDYPVLSTAQIKCGTETKPNVVVATWAEIGKRCVDTSNGTEVTLECDANRTDPRIVVVHVGPKKGKKGPNGKPRPGPNGGKPRPGPNGGKPRPGPNGKPSFPNKEEKKKFKQYATAATDACMDGNTTIDSCTIDLANIEPEFAEEPKIIV